MRILVSNDDGIYADGLPPLVKELEKLGDVWVVAPVEEQSTKGHSLTLHKPLRIMKLKNRFYGVTGTPPDCISLALKEVMKQPPDIVVSGVNRGANLGQDVFYSGTVSAAREAAIRGIRSFAVSLDVGHHVSGNRKIDYAMASKLTVKMIKMFKDVEIPDYTVLNLNVPNIASSRIKGFTFAKQGFRHYSGSTLKRSDHRGREYFWVGGHYKGFKKEEGSDCTLVDQGFATITPLKLDTTDHVLLNAVKKRFSDKDLKVK